MATERRISWIISANVKQWQKGLNKAQRRMDRFGRKMQRAGRSLTRNVTMPLVGAAGAAAKFASDFESSLSQSQAQADLTAQQVSFIGDSAKEMAQRTGESMDEIIEAYKFTISAGKNLAESQEIVKAAAEASAAGFGEQRDLVRTATTALEAYSDRLDSGREFMDLLVGSGQVMELEVSKLSGAMQRNVGVANNLGIGLRELLAGIGAVSEIMGDAQRGGRSMAAMLNSLLSPSAEAKKAIEGVFGSLTNMREALREDGLIDVMLMLRKELEASSEEGLGLIFSQRALEAALNLTNNQAQRAIELFGKTADTAGDVKSAFDAVSETTEKNFLKSLRSVQVTAIEMGEVMLPIVNKLLEGIQNLAKRFQGLSKEVRTQAVLYAGLAAAAGPLLIVFGKMVSGLAAILSPAFLAQAALVGLFAATVTTGQWFVDNWDKISQGFSNAMTTMTITAKKMSRGVLRAIKQVVSTIVDLPAGLVTSVFGIDLSEITADFTGINTRLQALTEDIENGSKRLSEGIARYNDLEWGSIGESASHALELAKNTLIRGLKGILNSSQIQSLIEQINNMMSASGGPSEAGSEDQGKVSIPFVDNIKSQSDKFVRGLEKMKAATTEFSARAALDFAVVGEASRSFSEELAANIAPMIARSVADMAESFVAGIARIVAAGGSIGNVYKGILNTLADLAIRVGKIAIGVGVAIEGIKKALESLNPLAAIAAGVALIALGYIAKTALSNTAKETQTRQIDVNDALVRSDGSIVNFHPDDNILAMKDFSKLGMAAGGKQVIHNQLNLDGQVVWQNQRRVQTDRGR